MKKPKELQEIKDLKRFDKRLKCGVYFLFKNDKIVYVGRSKDIISRVAIHIKEKEKDFDSYSFIEYKKSEISFYETYYILECLPKYNKVIETKQAAVFGWYTEKELNDMLWLKKDQSERLSDLLKDYGSSISGMVRQKPELYYKIIDLDLLNHILKRTNQ